MRRKVFKIASFFATEKTMRKYFPESIITFDNSDLYTKISLILKESTVAIFKESPSKFVVYAKNNDPELWHSFKSSLSQTYSFQ